jgi:coproporphyrinogen III oxidase-like Fe-S oxidoreductase
MYVQVLYCHHWCDHCNFAIIPVSVDADAGKDNDNNNCSGMGFGRLDRVYPREMLDKIEILGRRSLLSDNVDATGGLCLVYFGGGAPLLAPLSTISAMLDAIQKRFVLADGVVVTMEMKPGCLMRTTLSW